MGELTAVLIVGFIVLGIYKTIELLVKRKERLLVIDKFIAHCENKEMAGSFHLPDVSFGKQDSGSWSLRISLLLMGVGMGSFVSFVTVAYAKSLTIVDYSMRGVISFACITMFGGLGLLVSYLIESQHKKQV
jgi:hypothetical protein